MLWPVLTKIKSSGWPAF